MFIDAIKLLETANSEAIQRDLDKIYRWSIGWHQRLVEGEANHNGHMSAPGTRSQWNKHIKQRTWG